MHHEPSPAASTERGGVRIYGSIEPGPGEPGPVKRGPIEREWCGATKRSQRERPTAPRQTPRRGRARFRLQTDDAGDYVRVGNGTFRLGTGVRDRRRASCREKGRRASRQAGTRRGGARRAKTKKPPEYPAVRKRGKLKMGRDGRDLGRSENGRHCGYPCKERDSISSFIGESPFWVDTIAGSEPPRRVRTINGPGFRPTAVFLPPDRERSLYALLRIGR